MYIKRYTMAALLLIVAVGGFVYAYITQDTIAIEFFGIPLPAISIAVLVIVPTLFLYFASVAHMFFYSFIGALNLRKYEKDYEKTIDAIADTYLGKKDRKYSFKTDRYKLLGVLLENTMIFPSSNLVGTTNNAKIDSVLASIEDIKQGKPVDLKNYNLLPSNALVIQNDRNKYKNGELTAEVLLSNASKYDELLRKEIYVDYVKETTLSSILKYEVLLTKESLYAILARVNADEHILDISNSELVSLITSVDLSSDDYIELSSVISSSGMIPEKRIKLFEMLSEKNEDAISAYLFTLFDLEMLLPANEILDISQADEYQNFKAYRALKECGKNFNIKLFV